MGTARGRGPVLGGRRQPVLLVVAAVLLAALATPSGAGQEATDEALEEGAARYGTSTESLRSLLDDPTASLGPGGRVIFEDPWDDGAPPEPSTSSPAEPTAAPPTDDPVFSLHSRPGSDKVIYLDFDGHVTTDTPWNVQYEADPIVHAPYDTDGDPESWSQDELDAIAFTFRSIAEDFAPFDVDVTTELPGFDALSRRNDDDYGVRVVMSTNSWNPCGCGGLAYLGNFVSSLDEPVFAFNVSAQGVAGVAAHEVGHSLYLTHDGTTTAVYYGGHGSGPTSWSPIMGSGYGRSVRQWSDGSYRNADNVGALANGGKGPEDLSVMSSGWTGVDLLPDDHGNLTSEATELVGPAHRAEGLITSDVDRDAFAFTTPGGTVRIEAAPSPVAPNLDIRLLLYTDTGQGVAQTAPAARLDASIQRDLAPGRYVAVVLSSGTGDPHGSPPTGYTSYGSVGPFTLEVAVPTPPGAPTDAAVSAADEGAELTWQAPAADGGSAITAYRVFRDGAQVHETADATTLGFSDSGLVNGTSYAYEVAAVNGAGEGPRADAGEVVPLPAAPTFVDVPTDHPFYVDVEWMASRGISEGYPPGPAYRPDASVSRQAMSAFLYRLAGEPAFALPTTPSFPDVPADHPFFVEVEWMGAAGITTGFGDGTFKALEPVSRQAMSAFVHRLADGPGVGI